MKRKQFTPEEIIALLRQADIELAQGKRVGEVCRSLGIASGYPSLRPPEIIAQTSITKKAGEV